jgi:hypothetical protein
MKQPTRPNAPADQESLEHHAFHRPDTHTVVTLEVSEAIWYDIASLLRDAGYDHVFRDGMIDMTGIALVKPVKPVAPHNG